MEGGPTIARRTRRTLDLTAASIAQLEAALPDHIDDLIAAWDDDGDGPNNVSNLAGIDPDQLVAAAAAAAAVDRSSANVANPASSASVLRLPSSLPVGLPPAAQRLSFGRVKSADPSKSDAGLNSVAVATGVTRSENLLGDGDVDMDDGDDDDDMDDETAAARETYEAFLRGIGLQSHLRRQAHRLSARSGILGGGHSATVSEPSEGGRDMDDDDDDDDFVDDGSSVAVKRRAKQQGRQQRGAAGSARSVDASTRDGDSAASPARAGSARLGASASVGAGGVSGGVRRSPGRRSGRSSVQDSAGGDNDTTERDGEEEDDDDGDGWMTGFGAISRGELRNLLAEASMPLSHLLTITMPPIEDLMADDAAGGVKQHVSYTAARDAENAARMRAQAAAASRAGQAGGSSAVSPEELGLDRDSPSVFRGSPELDYSEEEGLLAGAGTGEAHPLVASLPRGASASSLWADGGALIDSPPRAGARSRLITATSPVSPSLSVFVAGARAPLATRARPTTAAVATASASSAPAAPSVSLGAPQRRAKPPPLATYDEMEEEEEAGNEEVYDDAPDGSGGAAAGRLLRSASGPSVAHSINAGYDSSTYEGLPMPPSATSVTNASTSGEGGSYDLSGVWAGASYGGPGPYAHAPAHTIVDQVAAVGAASHGPADYAARSGGEADAVASLPAGRRRGRPKGVKSGQGVSARTLRWRAQKAAERLRSMGQPQDAASELAGALSVAGANALAGAQIRPLPPWTVSFLSSGTAHTAGLLPWLSNVSADPHPTGCMPGGAPGAGMSGSRLAIAVDLPRLDPARCDFPLVAPALKAIQEQAWPPVLLQSGPPSVPYASAAGEAFVPPAEASAVFPPVLAPVLRCSPMRLTLQTGGPSHQSNAAAMTYPSLAPAMQLLQPLPSLAVAQEPNSGPASPTAGGATAAAALCLPPTPAHVSYFSPSQYDRVCALLDGHVAALLGVLARASDHESTWGGAQSSSLAGTGHEAARILAEDPALSAQGMLAELVSLRRTSDSAFPAGAEQPASQQQTADSSDRWFPVPPPTLLPPSLRPQPGLHSAASGDGGSGGAAVKPTRHALSKARVALSTHGPWALLSPVARCNELTQEGVASMAPRSVFQTDLLSDSCVPTLARLMAQWRGVQSARGAGAALGAGDIRVPSLLRTFLLQRFARPHANQTEKRAILRACARGGPAFMSLARALLTRHGLSLPGPAADPWENFVPASIPALSAVTPVAHSGTGARIAPTTPSAAKAARAQRPGSALAAAGKAAAPVEDDGDEDVVDFGQLASSIVKRTSAGALPAAASVGGSAVVGGSGGIAASDSDFDDDDSDDDDEEYGSDDAAAEAESDEDDDVSDSDGADSDASESSGDSSGDGADGEPTAVGGEEEVVDMSYGVAPPSNPAEDQSIASCIATGISPVRACLLTAIEAWAPLAGISVAALTEERPAAHAPGLALTAGGSDIGEDEGGLEDMPPGSTDVISLGLASGSGARKRSRGSGSAAAGQFVSDFSPSEDLLLALGAARQGLTMASHLVKHASGDADVAAAVEAVHRSLLPCKPLAALARHLPTLLDKRDRRALKRRRTDDGDAADAAGQQQHQAALLCLDEPHVSPSERRLLKDAVAAHGLNWHLLSLLVWPRLGPLGVQLAYRSRVLLTGAPGVRRSRVGGDQGVAPDCTGASASSVGVGSTTGEDASAWSDQRTHAESARLRRRLLGEPIPFLSPPPCGPLALPSGLLADAAADAALFPRQEAAPSRQAAEHATGRTATSASGTTSAPRPPVAAASAHPTSAAAAAVIDFASALPLSGPGTYGAVIGPALGQLGEDDDGSVDFALLAAPAPRGKGRASTLNSASSSMGASGAVRGAGGPAPRAPLDDEWAEASHILASMSLPQAAGGAGVATSAGRSVPLEQDSIPNPLPLPAPTSFTGLLPRSATDSTAALRRGGRR